MNEFARRVSEARRTKGHTQTMAAEIVRVVQSQWSKYELGKAVPEVERWPAFADYLGIDVDELSSLVAGVNAARSNREPDARLEAEVARLGAEVVELGEKVHKALGGIEALAILLRTERAPTPPPEHPRAPQRRAAQRGK